MTPLGWLGRKTPTQTNKRRMIKFCKPYWLLQKQRPIKEVAACSLHHHMADKFFCNLYLLRRQFAWNVKAYFLGKIRKIFKKKKHLLKFLRRMQNIWRMIFWWYCSFHISDSSNLYHFQRRFSRQQIDDIFLFFHKTGFDISCKLCMKCHSLFFLKKKEIENNSKCHLLIFFPSTQSGQ